MFSSFTRGNVAATLRRIPRAAWACALVAILNAACWSLISPPFQVIDEPDHFAYVQQLAETGHLPNSNQEEFSPEEETVLRDLHQKEIRWHPEVEAISSPTEVRQLRTDLSSSLARAGAGAAGQAASEPPLYYALETIPYGAGSTGTLLDRLELMRLLSALMAGVTALFTFLFVREALPRVPWAWTVGGVATALAPLLGFTSGAVTPDAMLYAVSAAIFYCLARAFRRGLTRKLAITSGLLAAAGFLTKLNFIGIAPGVVLGFAVLAVRGARRAGGVGMLRRNAGSIAVASVIAATPLCVYILSNILRHHQTLGLVSSALHIASARPGRGSFIGDVSYIWQFYLPRLPGMIDYFPGISMVRQVWFDRTVGLYGWVDTTFPVWVSNLALIPAGLLALLGGRTLIARWVALRARLAELFVYASMSAGLMALTAEDARLQQAGGAGWTQPRYLLPLLPLVAVAIALAARGGGRRWGPVVGALIVVLVLAQDIFSQLLVVSRFYG